MTAQFRNETAYTGKLTYKTLEDLSFNDLYVDNADNNFPHISQAVETLFSGFRTRKPKTHDDAHTGASGHSLFVHILHPPWLGI